jgi:rhodanese-related sulfurtransferase
MSTGLQALVISVVALLGSLAVWAIKGAPVRLTDDEVRLTTVIEDWGGEVLWVDARKRDEWQRNGLEGSVLINLDADENLDSLIAEALPRLAVAKRVVIYCGDAGCGTSHEVSRQLCSHDIGVKGDRTKTEPTGDLEIYVLHGGWEALAKAGLVRVSDSR